MQEKTLKFLLNGISSPGLLMLGHVHLGHVMGTLPDCRMQHTSVGKNILIGPGKIIAKEALCYSTIAMIDKKKITFIILNFG